MLLAASSIQGATEGLVVVRDVPMTTMCPHHLLPATGTATIAMHARERFVGLGTLASLVDAHARRLSLRERIGEAVVADIEAVTRDGLGRLSDRPRARLHGRAASERADRASTAGGGPMKGARRSRSSPAQGEASVAPSQSRSRSEAAKSRCSGAPSRASPRRSLRPAGMRVPYIVVANAGVVHRAAVHTMSEAQWDETIDVNLEGTLLIARAFLPRMLSSSVNRADFRRRPERPERRGC